MIILFLLHLVVKGLKAILTPIVTIPLVGILILITTTSPFDYKSSFLLVLLGASMQFLKLHFKSYRTAYFAKKISIHFYQFPVGLTTRDLGYYTLSYCPAILVLFLLFLIGDAFNLSLGNPFFLLFISCVMVFLYALNPFLRPPRFSVNGHSHSADEKLMPIHIAADNAQLKVLVKHIAQGVKEINRKTNFGNSALHFAIKSKNNEAVQLLINANAVVNCINNQAETPVMFAASNHDLKMVELLLANKAAVNQLNNNQENVLFYCLTSLPVFSFLVYKGATITTINSQEESLLSVAAGLKTKSELFVKKNQVQKTNAKDLVAYLLEQGLSPNGIAKETAVPIIKAVSVSNTDVVKLLLAKGANPNIVSKEKETALSTAITGRNISLVKLLVANNADINLCIPVSFYCNDLVTPLELAYETSSLYGTEQTIARQNNIIDYLIQEGALFGSNSKYNRFHLLREIRLLKDLDLYLHIVSLPQVHLAEESIELTKEELKWYFMQRFLQNKSYLSMRFDDISYYFEILLKASLVNENTMKECFVMLFLNAPDIAIETVLAFYIKYPDNKEIIQSTAKNVLKAAYNQELNEPIYKELAKNNKTMEAIDIILEKRCLNILLNKNQDKKTANKILSLRNNLETDFDNARKDVAFVANYIHNSEELVRGSKNPDSLSFTLANYTTKLLIKTIQQSFFEASKQLFFSYVKNIYVYTGFHEKSEDVASNALVLSLLIKDDTISKLVFEVILNEKFNIQTTNNAVLLFNLACYYAVKGDKENLIIATKFAIKNGKEASQFLADTDFKSFLKDDGFRAVLSQ
ncbi:MAG: ankyrin repeat domain-containing protein [Cellulophaga sp.]